MYNEEMNWPVHKSIRLLFFSFIFICFIPKQSFATSVFAAFTLSDSVGSSAATNETSKTKINLLNVGVNYGLKFYSFFLIGGRSSYSNISQTSESVASIGNRSGSRTIVASPLIGFDFKYLRLQADYQLSGDYALTGKTSSGDSVVYKKPSGLGVDLLLKVKSWVALGFRYEKVNFSEQQVGSLNSAKLTDILIVNTYGAFFSYYY